jgi:hypothetical protein
MLLFWGLCGVLYALFVPGAAIVSMIRPRGLDRARSIVSSFVIPILFVYAASFLIVMLGLPPRGVHVTLFVLSLLSLPASQRAGSSSSAAARSTCASR